MPKVPVYQTSVNSAALPGAKLQGGATAESFGGADNRQLSQLGSAASNLGGVGYQIAAKEQDRLIQDEVRSQMNSVRDQSRKKMSEFYNLKGEDAKDVVSATEKYYADLKKNVTKGAQTAAQQDMFNRQFDAHRASDLASMTRHQSQERQRYHDASLDASSLQAVESAVVNRDNPEQIAISEVVILKNTEERYRGAKPDFIKAQAEQRIQEMHGKVIDALTVDSPAKAKAYLEKNEKKLDPVYVVNKKKYLIDKDQDLQAFAFARQMESDPKQTEDEALAQADKEFTDPEANKKARNEVKIRFADRRRLKAQAQVQNSRDAWNQAADALLKAGDSPLAWSVNNLTVDVDPREKAKIQGWVVKNAQAKAEGRRLASDGTVYRRVRNLFQSDPAEFLNEKPESVIPHLTGPHLEDYLDMVDKAKNGIRKESDDMVHNIVQGYTAKDADDVKRIDVWAKAFNYTDSATLEMDIYTAWNKAVRELPVEERDNPDALAKLRSSLFKGETAVNGEVVPSIIAKAVGAGARQALEEPLDFEGNPVIPRNTLTRREITTPRMITVGSGASAKQVLVPSGWDITLPGTEAEQRKYGENVERVQIRDNTGAVINEFLRINPEKAAVAAEEQAAAEVQAVTREQTNSMLVEAKRAWDSFEGATTKEERAAKFAFWSKLTLEQQQYIMPSAIQRHNYKRWNRFTPRTFN